MPKPSQKATDSIYIKRVDLKAFPLPSSRTAMDETAQLTIGDLHGNALKFLFFLIKHNVFTNVEPEDYAQFVKLYHKDTEAITQDDLLLFDAFLSKIAVNNKGVIRFLGDDLADRGSNDYFTLKLFEKLHQAGANFEIILSNHSNEFIKAFEKGDDYSPSLIFFGQSRSLVNLNHLIERGIITKDAVDTLFWMNYLPHLKALSYTINEANNAIAIFSHAPIGLETIRSLAKKLDVPFIEDTLLNLATTIDNINIAFANGYIQTKTISHLLNDDVIVHDPNFQNIDYDEDPFLFSAWNRNYDKIERPREHNGYTLKFIHGHDSTDPIIPHARYDLDNDLGKGSLTIGEYEVHYTHEKQLPNARVMIVPSPKESATKPDPSLRMATNTSQSDGPQQEEEPGDALETSPAPPPSERDHSDQHASKPNASTSYLTKHPLQTALMGGLLSIAFSYALGLSLSAIWLVGLATTLCIFTPLQCIKTIYNRKPLLPKSTPAFPRKDNENASPNPDENLSLPPDLSQKHPWVVLRDTLKAGRKPTPKEQGGSVESKATSSPSPK
ncbi:MAG TPA: Dot/Icm T4SS effector Wip [Gammaproteobacteria bacterium]|nr:Dot/Icm T4SS effector Wip [Gammaproteobacteria bacterium]